MTFYNKSGKPIAYTEDHETLYLFTGEPVAYIHDNAIYGYNGKQFGWLENGWIRDLHGSCAFFNEETTGSGPVRPIKNISPIKHIKKIKPIKSVRNVKRVKAVNALSWSTLSCKEFFYQ